jgi:hypothetical protein
VDPTSCPWDAFDPATISFCEERLCAWVKEPANAWTSPTKTLVGIAILAHGLRRRPGARRASGALLAIGVSASLMGFGGFALHATGTFWGEVLDVSGMFLTSGLGLTFTLRRAGGWSDGRLISFFVALVGASVALLLVVRPSGVWTFGAQIAGWIGMEIWLWRRGRGASSYRQLNLVWASFGVGFVVWSLDKSGAWCDPQNHWLNGHAVWHVLTSTAIGHFYLYQRQFFETPSD